MRQLEFWKAFPNYGLRYIAGTVQTDKQTERYFSFMVGTMNDTEFKQGFYAYTDSIKGL
jgi:hypothetical protein